MAVWLPFTISYSNNKYREELNIHRKAFGFGVFSLSKFSWSSKLLIETCFEDLEIKKQTKRCVLSTSEPKIVRTGDEELFGESAAVKGSNLLLQDHNQDPANTEMERPLQTLNALVERFNI